MFTLLLNFLTRLKMISKLFIMAEALDLGTTLGGMLILPQLWETNPLPSLPGGWTMTVATKTLATVLVVYVLEKVNNWPELVRIVPLLAALPVFWNLLAILLEMMI